MSRFQDSLEIAGNQVTVKVNGVISKKVPVTDFVRALQNSGDLELFPGILPEGVRYVVRRGQATVVVVEQVAMPRMVFVIAKDSPAAYGAKVKSVRRWLSFPYLCLIVLFHGPALSGYQQIFYRTKPLTSLEDDLFVCNLPNVSAHGPAGLPYWFCSQYIGRVHSLPWPDKIKQILNHIWKSGWNWSSDHHEGLSQFTAMKSLDKRISSFETWEQETRQDPNFALNIKWQSSGINLKQAIDKLFKYTLPKNEIVDCQGLVNVLTLKRGDLATDLFEELF